MIDHSILHPTMTEEDLKRECAVAAKYDVASANLLSQTVFLKNCTLIRSN